MIRTCRSGQMVEILADCHLDRELRGVPCDAARSPRRPAIRFFCEDPDPVSVHPLAPASQEILRDLLHARGDNEASLKDPDDRVKPERRTLWFEDYRLLRDVASLEIEHAGSYGRVW